MKKHIYIAPEISIVSVALESGLAQSDSASGYGSEGAAGAGGEESGSTDW